MKGGEFLDRDLMVTGPGAFRSRFAFESRRRPDIVDSFNAVQHWGSAETGLFIDEEQKLLLVDGGEMSRWHPDWAAVALSLIGARWVGWDVRWFARDWRFVAQHLGVPCSYEPVTAADSAEAAQWRPEDPGPDWIRELRLDRRYSILNRTVLAARRDGLTELAVIKSRVSDVVARGPSIVDDGGWSPSLSLEAACTAGLHLDYDEKTFTYYGHTEAASSVVRRFFPGWTERRVWSPTDFEECVGRTLTVKRIGEEALLRQVVGHGNAELSHLESEVIPGLVLDLGFEDLAFELAEASWPWEEVAPPPGN